jgi:hypothetical protein
MQEELPSLLRCHACMYVCVYVCVYVCMYKGYSGDPRHVKHVFVLHLAVLTYSAALGGRGIRGRRYIGWLL